MISLERVCYTYPFQSQPAVLDLNLNVASGEAVAVTGASGCGKSTLLRLINGLVPWYFQGDLQGQITVNGKLNHQRCLHAISRDVGTLFQDPEQQLFALSVEDEIALAHEWRNVPAPQIRSRVDASLERLGISELAGANVHHLSEGEKQKIALASILSLEPRVLILDEPTANLDPESTLDIARILEALKAAGMTLIIVDHRLYWLTELVDRVLIMEQGRIVHTCPPSDLAAGTLRQRYGLRRTTVHDARPQLPTSERRDGKHIVAEQLQFAYRHGPQLFSQLNLRLPRGEVIGMVGGNGAGKTTLARLLTGLLRPQNGHIEIAGVRLAGRSLLRQASIVLQNTDHQLHMKTVYAELAAAANGAAARVDDPYIMSILAAYGLSDLAQRHPQSLSGGEKQRLVIACGHVRRPDIFILDEPTSGLDGANLKIITANLAKLANEGACVMVITHDLELLDSTCTCKIEIPCQLTTKATP